jgi:hypothetical protein
MADPIGENASTHYSVETIASEAALAVLEADWNRISESAEPRNVFTTFGWFRTWAQHIAREDCRGRFRPNVLLLKQNEKVVGISPLIRRISSHFGIRVRKLEFVTRHADYNDLVLGGDLVSQDDAVADFLARTAEQWDIVDLRDLRDTGEGTALIENALARNGLPYRILPEKDGCPYLSIDGDSAKLMKRLSGYVRRTLRKRRERAVAEGVCIRIIENPQQEPGLVEKLMALDHQKYLRSLYGCATQKWKSGSAASLPIVLELAIEMAAAESDDSVGPADCPEHAGLFEA